MYQQFYTHSTLLFLPLFAMALFMVTFAAVVWRAFRRRGDPERERHLLHLPLADDVELCRTEPFSEQGQGDRHGR